jgi:hypothetical protein
VAKERVLSKKLSGDPFARRQNFAGWPHDSGRMPKFILESILDPESDQISDVRSLFDQ